MEEISALSLLVYHSLDEDEFGVVQRDLRSLISLYMSVFVLVERNLRLRQMRPHSHCHSEDAQSIEQALSLGLNRIASPLKSYLAYVSVPVAVNFFQ